VFPIKLLHLKAWSIGKLLRNRLRKNSSEWIVEHVFNGTLYLKDEREEMSVVSVYPWRSLFSINVNIPDESFSFKNFIKPSYSLRISDENILIIGNIVIDTSTAGIYASLAEVQGFKRKVPVEELKGRADKLVKIVGLIISGIKGTSTEYLHRIICKHLIECSIFSEESVKSLIGLGEGFTPSGDDFYVGLLASLNYSANVLKDTHIGVVLDDLKRFVTKHSAKTTWASRWYLRYALEFFDEVVERALYAFFYGSEFELFENSLLLLRRGHESGPYIMLGMVVGLNYVIQPHADEWRKRLCSYLT